MRVLVIGGTGFVGAWIVRQLRANGDQVTSLHRGTRAADTAGVDQVVSTAPLSTTAPYEQALRHGEPDAVIHTFAMCAADAVAAVASLQGRTGRFVLLSSGDVYRAYARFTRLEPGPPDPVPLNAHRAPLRTWLYPYRTAATPAGTLEHDYDKILVENIVRATPLLPWTILRLPKPYGAGQNADFATARRFASQPEWRWTHGYVENVAAAAVLASRHPAASNRIYNVGEEATPTVAERLRGLPPDQKPGGSIADYDFTQHLVYDTAPIRRELGYREIVSYSEGLRRTLGTPS